MKQWLFYAGITPLLVSTPSLAEGPATTQETRTSIDYAQPVAQRPIVTEEETRIIRLGSWKLTPRAELSETFNSNIYATSNNVQDDFITVLKPTVKLDSDWSVHQIRLELGGNFGWYQDFSDEDYQDYYASNRNRLEVVRGTNILTDVLARHAHAPRSSPDSIGASAEPTTYDILRGMLGVEHEIGLFGLRVDVSAEDMRYDDTDRFGGGTIDNSYRDRTVLDGGFKLTYKPDPDSQLYGAARLNDVTYDDSTRNGRPDRDNSGFEVTLGARKNISDLWLVDTYLGYAPRFYVDSSLDDVTGGDALVLGTKVLWNPTALTSVIGNLERKSFETTQTGASALVNTVLRVRVEHKLTPSLVLDGNLGYTYGQYSGAEREDDDYRIGLGAAYFFTKLISVRAEYAYRERDSSIDTNDYDEHTASLQLRFNY